MSPLDVKARAGELARIADLAFQHDDAQAWNRACYSAIVYESLHDLYREVCEAIAAGADDPIGLAREAVAVCDQFNLEARDRVPWRARDLMAPDDAEEPR